MPPTMGGYAVLPQRTIVVLVCKVGTLHDSWFIEHAGPHTWALIIGVAICART